MPRVLVIILLALVVAPAAHAEYLGPDLSTGTDDPNPSCFGSGDDRKPCTLLQTSIGDVDLAIPFDGIITSWAVRDSHGTLGLRIIEGDAGARHVVASGPATVVPGLGVQTFTVTIPVKLGQRVGVDVSADGGIPIRYRQEGTTGERYDPPLGETPQAVDPSAIDSQYEVMYGLTVETDLDKDGLADDTRDPDHGGKPQTAGCPTDGVVLTGQGGVILRSGNTFTGCRNAAMTQLGTTSRKVKLKRFRLTDARVALVRVKKGRPRVQLFDLATQSRTFRSPRLAQGRGVSDLEVSAQGNAAWMTVLPGKPAKTKVFVFNGSRVMQIDEGRIPPTSLTLAADGSGINYIGPDGEIRNSGF